MTVITDKTVVAGRKTLPSGNYRDNKTQCLQSQNRWKANKGDNTQLVSSEEIRVNNLEPESSREPTKQRRDP